MSVCVINNECIACDACFDVCPRECIEPGDIYHVDPVACEGCGSCADVCPTGACIIH
ncbi:MAG: 4Fe-4S binding protein [Deltaproteobacteria bacterium]|nr:4Fe-4S binding protein [Deltaproteobacteria bacterium]